MSTTRINNLYFNQCVIILSRTIIFIKKPRNGGIPAIEKIFIRIINLRYVGVLFIIELLIEEIFII